MLLRDAWQRLKRPHVAPSRVAFRCNICGARNEVAPALISRETPSCAQCGSTVRWRSIVHLVCRSLVGMDVVATDMLPRRDLSGLGLSDDACVATALARAFDYTNTYYHAEPRLDIANIPDNLRGRYDFLSASDVFEHVVPPVGVAFANARRLLKPGGVFVFTVPFSLDADTIEHFPDLHDFRVVKQQGKWRLFNRTREGGEQQFDDLVFHGGPGTTLEMRLFSRAALERHFAEAGFSEVRFASEPCPQFGIEWPEPWSIPIVARA